MFAIWGGITRAEIRGARESPQVAAIRGSQIPDYICLVLGHRISQLRTIDSIQFGTRATHLIATHAFGPLGLRRLSVRVLGYNARAVACFRKAGFVEEGRAREAAFVAGDWHDDILMGLLKTEYTPAVYDTPKRRKSAKTRNALKEPT